MPFYVQIDSDGICYAVTETADEIKQADMIPVSSMNAGLQLLGKRRTGSKWEEVPEEIDEPSAPSEPDAPPKTTASKLARLETQNLILMDALATVYAETLGDKADEQTLVDLYTPLVEAGRKTIEQVPEKIKNAVQGRLSAKGDGGVKDAN